MIDTTSWVILFGGKGREKIVTFMVENNLNVCAVFLLHNYKKCLSKSEKVFIKQKLLVEWVTKNSLKDKLCKYYNCNLLSVGFQNLLEKDIYSKHPISINVHPSLLPKYRGPTALPYVLINGETKAGSTVHFVNEKMDDGNIIDQREIQINCFDTVNSLKDKIYNIEPKLVIDAINKIKNGYKGKIQKKINKYIYKKKRNPEDSELDPFLPLKELYNYIRACDNKNYPAFFYVNNEKVYVKLWSDRKNKKHPREI